MKTVAFILGTRPEIIKLAPLILMLEKTKILAPAVIFTGQHQTMARQAFDTFGITPRIDLSIARSNQSQTTFLGALLQALEPTLEQLRPLGIVVQGDTTTALGGALAGFQLKIPCAHAEAGLRTYDSDSPFPEEMNRTLLAHLAQYHFCPTANAKTNLQRQGVTKNVFMTGSLIVDAARLIEQRVFTEKSSVDPLVRELKPETRNYLLVTAHRLENFDQGLKNLCSVLTRITEAHPDLEVIFPVHPNPNIRDLISRELKRRDRIHILPSLDYASFITLLKHARFVISDSGGVQEEASIFKKRVFIARRITERQESIEKDLAELTPLDNPDRLFEKLSEEIKTPSPSPFPEKSPYGDGTTAKQISYILGKEWG